MTLLRKTLALLMLVAAVLLAAGCAGQSWDGKSSGNKGSSVSIISSLPMQTQNQSLQVQNSDYWIKMDPITDKNRGDQFSITAKTNLPIGDEILVQVYSSTFYPGGHIPNRDYLTSTIYVIKDEQDLNKTEYYANTSSLKPDEYIVTEDSVLRSAACSELFRILPTSGSAGNITAKSKRYIEWDKLDIPHLILNNSMQPVIPDIGITLSSNRTEPGRTPFGTIIVFSADGIVRFFDKNGTQTAAYYDYSVLHSTAVPNGARIGNPVGNVTTVTYGGERILMEIYEAGDSW